MVDFLKNLARALHDDVAAIGEPVASFSASCSSSSVARTSVLIMTPNVDHCRDDDQSRDACCCGQRE